MTIKNYGRHKITRQRFTVDTTGELGVRVRIGHRGYNLQVRLSYPEVDALIDQLTDWLFAHDCDVTTLGDLVE